jgi:hypothetical protein
MFDKERGKVKILSDDKGENYSVLGADGQLHKGTVVIKPVFCGKKCKGCPHCYYKYVCWRENNKTRWKYIGKVEKVKECLTTQKNSAKPQP